MYIVNIIDFFHRSIHMHLPRVKPSPAFTINFACGVLGAKYAFNYTPSESVLIRPEIRAAVKYDFLSDAALSTDIISDILVYKTLTKNPPNGGFFARVHLL